MSVTKYLTFFISSDPAAGAKNRSARGDRFQVILDRPISLPNNCESAQIRVLNSSIWNVVPNISADIGNNTLAFTVGGTSYTSTIPDGLYSLDALEDFIQRDLTNKGLDPTAIQFSGNGATQRTVITFGVDNVQLDLTVPNSPTELLGFNARLVPLTPQVAGYSEPGDTTANFNRTEFFLISSDLISNGIPINSTSGSGILHKALIQAQPGSQSNFLPYIPSKVDASELIGQAKNAFIVTLTDQLGRQVDTQGENFAFTMELSYTMPVGDVLTQQGQRVRW